MATMFRGWRTALVAMLGSASLALGADRAEVGEVFTWQAELTEAGAPYSGTADLAFTLFDADLGGSQVGPTLVLTAATLTNGRIVADLDFGTGAFDGEERWLRIGVRTPAWDGQGAEPAYTFLDPRQPILPSPYAIRAKQTDWAGLTNVPPGFADGIDNDTNSVETWSTLAGIPAGFADGIDDDTTSVETWTTLAGIPSGFADDSDDGILLLAAADKAWFDGNIGAYHNDPQIAFSIDRFGSNEVGMGQGILSNQGLELLTTDSSGGLATRVLISNNTDNAIVQFYRGSGGSEATTMIIDSSGNVGIGLDSPDRLLDVGEQGSPRFQVTQNTTDNGVIFGNLTDTGGRLSMSGRGSVEVVIDNNDNNNVDTFQVKKDGELNSANAELLMEVREGGLVVISDDNNPGGANGGLTIHGGSRGTPLVVNSDSGNVGIQVNMDATTGTTEGGRFVNDSTEGVGVRGRVLANSGATIGVWGETDSATGYGVYGEATRGTGRSYGVYGATDSSDALAYGVYAAGNLGSSGVKTFLIDHPLDPGNAYLIHYSAEGPEPQNIYNGVITLDALGEAWVELPVYFDAINTDPRYQLTAIGGPAPLLHVAQKIAGNTFLIAGGDPGMEVSWEVKARRSDPGTRRMTIEAVRPKTGKDVGRYLQPEVYGQPKSMAIHGHQAPAAPADPSSDNESRN